jgi:hypothetical protein
MKNKEELEIPTRIKNGRLEFDIHKGDYILDNGSCIQFMTGDRRILYRKKRDAITSFRVSKVELNKIPLDKLDKKITTYGGVAYYF